VRRSPLDEVTAVATDAAYVSVGLGLIAFQRLQVRRQELRRSLREPTSAGRAALDLLAERVVLVEERLRAR
jgi:hypothetical protein